MVERRLDQRLDLRLPADIARDHGGLAAGCPDGIGDWPAGLGLPARNDHGRTEPAEQFRRRLTDAAGRAGHDRDLAGEIEGIAHRTNSHPRSASRVALSPCEPASPDEALPCFARASTPSRMTARRNSENARWNGVISSVRPLRLPIPGIHIGAPATGMPRPARSRPNMPRKASGRIDVGEAIIGEVCERVAERRQFPVQNADHPGLVARRRSCCPGGNRRGRWWCRRLAGIVPGQPFR